MEQAYKSGKMILVDKPLNWTSFDIVNYLRMELRKKAGIKEIKIGHAGTLDPLASGLVIVCTGKWTKRINEFQDMEKEYVGQFTMGATTPSFDLETEIDATYPVDHITEEMIRTTADSFLGQGEQYPPMYSAIKIKGKRAYEYAREGKEVQIQPKSIHISAFDISLIEENLVTFRIRCSKGTYVRSIARDFGKKLGSGAYLSQLRRTAIGDYLVVNAITPAEFSLELTEDFM
jgi:tRNA pseudouridine55 synthase